MTANYNNPTSEAYWDLLSIESFLVQMIERYEELGHLSERDFILETKKNISIRRQCMKGALRLKEAQLRAS